MNIRALPPEGITATQSPTWVLREVFINVLAPLFPQFKIIRTNQVPILQADIPVLGVYLLDEKLTPFPGDDIGDIKFHHHFRFGFSAVIANNDPDAAESKLDAIWWTLSRAVFMSLPGMKFMGGSTHNPDGRCIEAIELGMRRFVFGNIGLNNETPTAELQFEMTGRYGEDYPPEILDYLDKMVVTVIPAGIDPTQTQPITVEYDWTSSG